ncbi:sugar ABC transporter permease [Cohnella sp. CIP 111063]|jgi:ABC-type sugar transport system, permease component|uniref:carbohydrate ABC transporter permease n=1 Tax=unclassified Cohnella TaxID=2636738 RepID=UPI000B8C32EB|nr:MULTISPECIES: carbohydrate ABC transporter permease [unclassified Cohnella]OXS56252.1 sugar ABC transporter permease [Cohnella sp. CIP 111063]PRX67891.1 N-acetylglucosamine transport system permease protein [Cohnella sp. SGD-V74]
MLNQPSRALKAVAFLILSVWAAAVLYPLLWTFLSALKDNPQFLTNKPWALPETPLLWKHFTYVWQTYNFGSYFMNSVLVTVVSSIAAIVLSASTAYVFSRFEFRGSRLLYVAYLSAMMIPLILGLIPLFFLLDDFGLINKLGGLAIVYTAWAIPFGVFVLGGFFKSLPKELEEAAYIDGAGYFRTFFQIMLPMAKSGLVTVTIVNALNNWNEYIMGTVFINDPTQYTLPVGIAIMQAEMQYRTEWGPLFAGLLISMAPVLLMYMFFQRQIVSGLTAGAIK